MAQQLRTPGALQNPEINSQQPHGGSQPSTVGTDALFWPKGAQAYGALIHKINK